ncbi:hypothetical protein J1614_011608 [Plenodomus biglobosus]|nr:hypothetical protein J1614_011608 [Plenodomus biglobosus]
MDPLSTTAPEPPVQSSPHHLRHMDRDSAIALAVLLILILSAIAYYTHSHIKVKHQIDLEQQQEAEFRASVHGSIGGPPWYNRGDGAGDRIGSRGSSMFKMKDLGSTVDSTASPGSTDSHGNSNTKLGGTRGRKGRQFPTTNPLTWLTSRYKARNNNTNNDNDWPQSSHSGYMFGTCTHNPPHPETESRPPSPCSPSTIQTPSHNHNHDHNNTDTQPCHKSTGHSHSHSHHHRSSSFPLSSSSSQPVLRIPLTQRQADRAWWRDVARHGSTTAASAQLSTLQTIPEPEMIYYATPIRIASRGAAGPSRASVADRRRRRSEGSGLYDWTRPASVVLVERAGETAVEAQLPAGVGTGGCNPISCSIVGGGEEGVQRTDWAVRTSDVGQ